MKLKIASIICIIFVSILLHECKITGKSTEKTKRKTSSFLCNFKEIDFGEKITLEWSIPDAENVNIEGYKNNLPSEGKAELYPDTSTTYKLIYKKISEKNEKLTERTLKTINIKVNKPIVNLSAPNFVGDESYATISWDVKFADYVWFTGQSDSLPLTGTKVLKLDSTVAFEFNVRNKFGFAVKKVFIINVFSEEELKGSNRIFYGDSAFISWKFKKTNYVEIESVNKKFKPTDRFVFYPEESKEYKIQIHRKDGTIDKKVFPIRIDVPQIVYFTAPKTIVKGKTAKLVWSVKGAQRIFIKNLKDSLPAKGSIEVQPGKNMNYVLVAVSKKRLGKTKEIESQIQVQTVTRKYIRSERSFVNLKNNERIDFEIIAVDRSNYPKEIKLHIVVVDSMGNFIKNLAPPVISKAEARKYFVDLIESVEGKNAKINNFDIKEVNELSAKPYDIAVALDYSGSMGGIIDSLEKAAKSFIQIKDTSDRISIIKFDNNISRVIELTKEKKTIMDSVKFEGLKQFGGYTALYAAGSEGLYSLSNSTNNKVLILFTDGMENSSMIYIGKRAYTPDMLVRQARQNNVRIQVVSFGDGANDKILEKVALLTDGKYYNVNMLNSINEVFQELPHIMRNYYVITYKPKSTEGEHGVKLVYNNQVEKNASTEKGFYVGENFNISEIDTSAYWYYTINNKIPIGPPQAVAFFDFDKTEILEKYKVNLLKFRDYFVANKLFDVIVLAHTDLKGSEDYCDELSKKRAESIKRFFIEQGIDENRITVIGCGKNYPIWHDEKNSWQAQENRRTELLILQ